MASLIWMPALTTIESFLRIFVYLTIIVVGFRAIQALGIYIGKNSK